MYLKRKIDFELDEWYLNKHKKPALITGIRQCGKTQSVLEFAKRHNKKILNINFWTNPEYCSDFEHGLDVDNIINYLQLRNKKIEINPEDTIIFFDEIQECPKARLAFKNFAIDSRYCVIGSGSYLGINGYNLADTSPAPTGYDCVFEMHTMDFEEFLWAIGYEKNIDDLVNCFKNRIPVPDNMHKLFNNVYKNYLCIGGFPSVVKEFIETNSLYKAYKVLNSLICDMKSDFGRRKGKDGSIIFKPSEIARIQQTFELIPTFLAKDNKRFIVSKIRSGSSSEKNDAIEYLKQAHIVNKVHNIEKPCLPLNGFKITSQFKIFPEDIGIVTAMYGFETLEAIQNDNLGQGGGAIYEAAVFDSFIKNEIESFYFAKETGLEIDFVIAYNGFPYLVEAKTKNGNTKSSKTVMKNQDHYGVTKLLRIGNYNIGEEGDVISIPHYLTFALKK